MSRRIGLRGRFASESLRLRPPLLEDFSKETLNAAKHSVGPARENPCPALAGAVFSQTLYMEGRHQSGESATLAFLLKPIEPRQAVQRCSGGNARQVTLGNLSPTFATQRRF